MAKIKEIEVRPVYAVKEKAQQYHLFHSDHDTVAVMVHGFTGSPYDMRELAEYLFERGVDSVSVRLAGHGTHIKELMNTSYDDWLASVEESIQDIKKSGKRIFLVGYSFGANIALDIASRAPEDYAGIICLGTSIIWRAKAYYFPLYYLFRALGIKKIRKPYVRRKEIEVFESLGNYADFPVKGLGMFRDVVKKRTRKQLHQITTPILIVHSSNDRISHPRSSEFLFDNVGSTYKEMFVLPDMNHNPLRSESRDKIFHKIVQFMMG